jgi:hypothetical protein
VSAPPWQANHYGANIVIFFLLLVSWSYLQLVEQLDEGLLLEGELVHQRHRVVVLRERAQDAEHNYVQGRVLKRIIPGN